jgi:hypothetical protein
MQHSGVSFCKSTHKRPHEIRGPLQAIHPPLGGIDAAARFAHRLIASHHKEDGRMNPSRRTTFKDLERKPLAELRLDPREILKPRELALVLGGTTAAEATTDSCETHPCTG